MGRKKKFKCNRCGICCERLNISPLFADMHDGSGICRYFDRKTRLCTIYRRRPIKCNIELGYERFFRRKMDYDTYLKMNYDACVRIQEQLIT